MKTMNINGQTFKYTTKDVTYDEAIKQTPKRFKMIDFVDVAFVLRDCSLKDFPFYFWIKNPEWNKKVWRPVARGSDYYFGLNADYYNLGASRGVYVKVQE